ncbi:MAG: FtsQ-type POTRA domain-containing protein [Vampirovibrio sp.]
MPEDLSPLSESDAPPAVNLPETLERPTPVELPESDASPPSTQTPRQDAQARRRQKIRHLWQSRVLELGRLVAFALLFYGLFIGFTLPQWTLTPSQIHVSGQRMMHAKRIQDALKSELGKHLLFINPIEIAQHVEAQDPLLASVQIRRQLLPTPYLEVQISEHRPWGLLYNPWEKATVLAWQQNMKDHPNAFIPPPFAFILDTYKSLHFTSQHYQLPPQSLANHYTLMFMDTLWYRQIPPSKRQALLQDLDRIIEGLRQIKGIDVQSIGLSKRQQVTLDVTFKGQSLQVVAGPLDAPIFKRVARLKATLPTIEKLNTQNPKNPIDRIDLRWNENVYLHRQNGSVHNNDPFNTL